LLLAREAASYAPRENSANGYKAIEQIHSGLVLCGRPSVRNSAGEEKIAQSLKSSALSSRRRKSSPYHSAMSMLSFYINRAGRNLPKGQKQILQQAKAELKKLFKHAG
jgi:hypothetical protein